MKWMHATCGYPVKPTWLKTIKAGNSTGWLIINERTVAKYYSETKEIPKRHLIQTRNKVRSTKPRKRGQRRLDAAGESSRDTGAMKGQ